MKTAINVLAILIVVSAGAFTVLFRINPTFTWALRNSDDHAVVGTASDSFREMFMRRFYPAEVGWQQEAQAAREDAERLKAAKYIVRIDGSLDKKTFDFVNMSEVYIEAHQASIGNSTFNFCGSPAPSLKIGGTAMQLIGNNFKSL